MREVSWALSSVKLWALGRLSVSRCVGSHLCGSRELSVRAARLRRGGSWELPFVGLMALALMSGLIA